MDATFSIIENPSLAINHRQVAPATASKLTPVPMLTALSSSAASSTTSRIMAFLSRPRKAILLLTPPFSVFGLLPIRPQMIPVR